MRSVIRRSRSLIVMAHLIGCALSKGKAGKAPRDPVLNVSGRWSVGPIDIMKLTNVVVSAHPGITVVVATRLVSAVKKTRSIVLLRCGERMANAGNILSILALCSAMGSTVEVQACGEDEALAASAVERILSEPFGDL
jgi:phosphotransferase system HPr (HPr) family protein